MDACKSKTPVARGFCLAHPISRILYPGYPGDDHFSSDRCCQRTLHERTFHSDEVGTLLFLQTGFTTPSPRGPESVVAFYLERKRPQRTFHLSPDAVGIVLSLWHCPGDGVAAAPVGVTHCLCSRVGERSSDFPPGPRFHSARAIIWYEQDIHIIA